MPRIMINYRRGDSSGHAGRLYSELREHFGEGQVFMDIDSIEPGVDFVGAIERAVRSTEIMLVVIGPGWLVAEGREGRRRLDDPGDFVRVEIEAALRSNIRVFPILVGGAEMPADHELPDALATLNRRHAFVLTDAAWRSDVDGLLRRLDVAKSDPSRPAPGSWLRRVAAKLRLARDR